MKKRNKREPDYRSLPFYALLNRWRVVDRGNPAIKKVAAEFGVSESTWSRWETGVRFPGAKQIQRLADFLGIPPCRFYCGPDWRCPRCVRCSE